MATDVGLTGLTNLLYCLRTPSRSLPLSEISLFSLGEGGRGSKEGGRREGGREGRR